MNKEFKSLRLDVLGFDDEMLRQVPQVHQGSNTATPLGSAADPV